ncbi:MarR family winged helix-turn-helix transcriptional regulator [Bosea sp. TWI1241]|jgi:DNA-binding MarR family transcriptional regulator|uniref:MarR family winged helix-turn-helix transcriptional regulator n=1 Tax=Bosea sp. TWI1241 TaxID=3148904 RepID=UPI003209B3F9
MTTPIPDPRLDDIGRSCVVLHVRMTARAVTRAYDEAMRPSGLKITQFVLLSALSTGQWRSVTELAERFALERTSLTRNLQLLAAEALIERCECKGRAQTYLVTEKGRAAIENAIPYWRLAQERIETALGSERWSETRDGLRAIRRAIRDVAPLPAPDAAG